MLFTKTTTDHLRKELSPLRNQELFARYINPYIQKDMSELIGALRMGESIHYANDTLFYLHDVIAHCLQHTGTADVFIATYAVKEYQAQLLARMKAEKIIENLYALIDYRNELHDAGAVQILKGNCAKMGFVRTHAKLVVIRNDKWGVSIVTSANLTKNTRLDVGVITCDFHVADERINWVKKHLNI